MDTGRGKGKTPLTGRTFRACIPNNIKRFQKISLKRLWFWIQRLSRKLCKMYQKINKNKFSKNVKENVILLKYIDSFFLKLNFDSFQRYSTLNWKFYRMWMIIFNIFTKRLSYLKNMKTRGIEIKGVQNPKGHQKISYRQCISTI